MDRSDIAEIIIDKNPDIRFYYPRATIMMKTGQRYFFDIGHGHFYKLIGDFCELDPPITLTYKRKVEGPEPGTNLFPSAHQ